MPRGGNGETDVSALDEGALCVAIELADEAMRGLSLPRQRYAALVAMLYAGVCQRTSYVHLLDSARSSATKMATG